MNIFNIGALVSKCTQRPFPRYQKLSSVKFWLACFFFFSCALARCVFALSCSHYLCRKEEIQFSDVGWVPRFVCETVKIPSREFKRGYSYVCDTCDQYQYPLNLTVAYLEPPALIAYLKLRGEESRCSFHAGAPRMLGNRWQMEISVCEEDTVTSSLQRTNLLKNTA